ncbi:MAG: lipoyl(octanoyl) transferase LipB [Alcanivorax sp.]|uniref:lipoyl(octanoyl) transferase LipB n=1 Tax=Alloalcanivorax marinus TaxID=1177169 RepID=UPI00195BAF34|nr:lipoyl(octanoyl) transferase LipB [Alloalcanivorax marinus]MBM7332552.1 lipoyl(octanoyl) transferase LipB [Alloalcanivorax marinus]
MNVLVRSLPRVDYPSCWEAMRAFTTERDANTEDEFWVLEHPPVYTLGQAGKPEHVLAPGEIPVVRTDRGGQVTYHGPGQTVIYLMVDVQRLGIGARAVVSALEDSVVDYLRQRGLEAVSRPDAPGVYVNGAKIASLGLRIRRTGSYHGLALNRVDDPAPWRRINPCGHAGQPMTSLAGEGLDPDRASVEQDLVTILARRLGLTPRTAPPPDWYTPPQS